jgi:RNA polymerase sigma factor (sigma-70 family)
MRKAHQTDAAYLAYVAAPSTETLESLISALRRQAFAIVWCRLNQSHPEIVAQAVSKTIHVLPAFRGEAQFSTWFHTIVRNYCNSELRKIVNTRNREQSIEVLPVGPADPSADFAPKLALQQAVAKLPPTSKTIVDLLIAGHSRPEIANILKLPLHEVWLRTRMAQDRLRGLLGMK